MRSGLLKSLRDLETETAFVEEKEKAISYHSESLSSDRALLWREECTLHTAYISALGESSSLCISCCA